MKNQYDIWSLGYSPINVSVLEKMLENYNDPVNCELLLNGFKFGFPIHYSGPRIPYEAKNLKSIFQYPEIAWEKVMSEVKMGRIAGPFTERPISNLRVSPIGLVPKKTGGFRLITNLSSPPLHSVNDFIDKQLSSVQYSTFDNAVDIIKKLGFRAQIAKMDIKSAFRLLPIYPGDFDLLGFKLGQYYFIDKVLPQGLALSCAYFTAFSNFLHHAVEQESGLSDIDHFLDDYFFAGSCDTNNCQKLMQCFSSICTKLNIPIATEKTEGPCTCLVYLGLTIDTEKMSIEIPESKLAELLNTLLEFQNRKKVTLKELQSLCGLLAFCSRALPAGRAFTRRFYLACSKVTMPHHFIRITKGMHEDIAVWILFLNKFNGISYMLDVYWQSNLSLKLFTDSAGGSTLGCGIYFDGKWTFLRWPVSWRHSEILRDITFLELIPITLAIYLWGETWKGKQILFYCDNNAVVSIINTSNSRSSRCMALVRYIVYWSLLGNFHFKAKFLPGSTNTYADLISRAKFQAFKKVCPSAEKAPVDVPQQFLDLLEEVC